MVRLIRPTNLRKWLLLLLAASLPLLLLTLRAKQVHSEENEITQIWHDVQRSGSYSFKADISQLTIPVATIYNVGRNC